MVSDLTLLQMKEMKDIDDVTYLSVARKRYIDGFNLRQQYVTKLLIGPDGKWSVLVRYSRKRKGFLSSGEIIGMSIGSNAFYKGVLDSMIEIEDHRQTLIAN